jgi:seryl-tRNA(Sec) selenium transferase
VAELAKLLLTEDALVVANGGAGLIAALAACGSPVLIQRGHVVDIGGSPLRLIEMAGGRPVEVGLVDRCDAAEIEAAGEAKTGLFVVEAAGPGLVDLPNFLWACHRKGWPGVAYLGPSRAWISPLDAGADLVVVDLGRSVGVAGGVVAGRAELVGRARRAVEALPLLLAASADTVKAAEAQLDANRRRSSATSDP